MKVVFATLLLLTLLLSSAFLEVTMASSGPDCQSKCKVRCSKSKKKPRCLKYCILCCKDCNCVPSGTYGNKHQCPCYKGMRNSKGNPKCP